MHNVKAVILDHIIEEVRTQIQNSLKGLESAMEDAKSHKGKISSRYDTFLEEAQYLARGHSVQVATLVKHLSLLMALRSEDAPASATVSVCSLVEVENLDDGSRTLYFFSPVGGGELYEVAGKCVAVVSIDSPVGRAFVNKVVEDEVVVQLPATTLRVVITSVF
jgi:transcription elongation GreA/GreB family factor